MTGRNSAGVLLLVLVLLITGCVNSQTQLVDAQGDGAGENGLAIPQPSLGERVVYRSDDGKVLEAEVVGVGNRTDGYLREHPSILLSITYWYDGRDAPSFEFEDAVHPSGFLTSQWTRCSARTTSDSGNLECLSERAAWVGSAQGLPGGFGAGPFWGGNVTPDGLETTLATVTGDPMAWDLHVVSDLWATREDCVSLEPRGLDTAWLRGLRFTGGIGPFTLCDGLAFPVTYTSLDGSTYRLQEHDPGRSAVEVGGSVESLNGSVPSPVPRVDRSFPLFVAHPEHETPFPVSEAHEVALERSKPYAELFEQGEETTIVRTHYRQKGSSRGAFGTSSEERYTRDVGAVDPDGNYVRVEIEKTVYEDIGPGGEEVSYEVTEERERTFRAASPTPESLNIKQADVAAAVDLGEQLTQREQAPSEDVKLRPSVKIRPWLNPATPIREDGYTFIAQYDSPPISKQPGLVIYAHYQVIIDGPQGTVLYVESDRLAINETFR